MRTWPKVVRTFMPTVGLRPLPPFANAFLWPELAQECRLLDGCPTGDARLTKGYRLPARYVIHAVGPVWKGGNNGEPALLASCYHRCLEMAHANGIATIAFPSISTGVYGYPIELAAKVVVDSIFCHHGRTSDHPQSDLLLLLSQ